MKTKKISLFYPIQNNSLVEPDIKTIEMKNRWVKDTVLTAPQDKKMYIQVTYEIYDPAVGSMRKFFHVCVKWYAVQHLDIFQTAPSNSVLKEVREELLFELLGYKAKRLNGYVDRRKSTTDFKEARQWYELIQRLKEEIFESHGYEFPESADFWKLASTEGYEEADRIMLEKIQKITSKKYEN